MRALTARAREHLRTWDGTVVAPRDAASVVVVRLRGDDPEVLLLRRPPTMAFAAGMHVFPGGSVQASDRDPVPWVGPGAQVWARRWGCEQEPARALVVAAVRETFEETGILFAGRGRAADGSAAGPVLGFCDGPEWAAARAALEAGGVGLPELLRERGLVLRADLLGAWAHWVTPEFEPRRFDTRFFVAALPDPGTDADDVRVGGAAAAAASHTHGTEADASFWIGARAAVQAAERDELAMMTPTLHNLRALAAAGRDGLTALLAGAGTAVVPVRPRLVEVDGEQWMTSLDESGQP